MSTEGGGVREFQQKARHLLQAAAVEAYGRPGAYVTRERLMGRVVNISDLQEFWAIAEYLEDRGWIAECDADYGIFVLTVEGLDEAMR